MGKGLAEFRKASDDFKRTWEREVALESARAESDNTILNDETNSTYEDPQNHDQPALEPMAPEQIVARENPYQPVATAGNNETPVENSQPEPLRKHDWV